MRTRLARLADQASGCTLDAVRSLALAVLALTALGRPTTITQTAIAGAVLGKPSSYYRAAFGRPWRLDRLEGGLERLSFPQRNLDVYFRSGGKTAIGIVTWSIRLRTSGGVGPCSTIADLHRAYDPNLVPFRQGGRLLAYRLGALRFTTSKGRVGAVQLSRAPLTVFAALNSPACSAGA